MSLVFLSEFEKQVTTYHNAGQLLKKTTEHMKMVKASPERVKTYFKDKHVAYAADSQ